MSIDLIEKYNNLKSSLIAKVSRKEILESNLRSSSLELASCEERLQELNGQKTTLFSAISVLKQMLDVLSSSQINELQSLLSYALKTIFTDRDYSIEIQVSESRNVKQAQFMLVETLRNGEVLKTDFKDSIGGGIQAVVGLIIQIYYISYYKQFPIIFMDEALSQISSQYLPSVMRFLDILAEKRNFHFVLVTHDNRIMEYGNRVYLVQEGKVTQVRGN